jgi:DNA-binding helix-hairpin-helix protein with protein kinase domain
MFVPRSGPVAPPLPDFSTLATQLQAEIKLRLLPKAPGTPPSECDHSRHVTGRPLSPNVKPLGFFGRTLNALSISEDVWTKELAERGAAVLRATLVYEAALANWQTALHRNVIAALIRETTSQCSRLANLSREAEAVISGATDRARSAALRSFLESFPIASASIEGIGRGIVALKGAGIDTAADVTGKALEAAPGLDPLLIIRVLVWRRAREAGFKDPATTAAPTLATILDKGNTLEAAIRVGLAKLDRMIAAEAARLGGVRADLDRLARDLAQARADRAIMH